MTGTSNPARCPLFRKKQVVFLPYKACFGAHVFLSVGVRWQQGRALPLLTHYGLGKSFNFSAPWFLCKIGHLDKKHSTFLRCPVIPKEAGLWTWIQEGRGWSMQPSYLYEVLLCDSLWTEDILGYDPRKLRSRPCMYLSDPIKGSVSWISLHPLLLCTFPGGPIKVAQGKTCNMNASWPQVFQAFGNVFCLFESPGLNNFMCTFSTYPQTHAPVILSKVLKMNSSTNVEYLGSSL